MRNPAYIYINRCGTYYFQKRLSVLKGRSFSDLPNLLRLSLKTKNRKLALLLARKLSVMYDDLAKFYFDTEVGYLQGKKLLEEYRDLCNSNASLNVVEEKFYSKLEDSDEERFFLNSLNYAKELARARNDYSLLPGFIKNSSTENVNQHIPISLSASSSIEKSFELLQKRFDSFENKVLNQTKNHLNPKKLSEAMEEFISQKKIGWQIDGDSEITYRTEVFPLFMEIVGDISTENLGKASANKYLNLILKYPKNRRKIEKFKYLTVDEILSSEIDSSEQLSIRTKQKYLNRLSGFLDWLAKNDYCLPNINQTLKSGISKRTRDIDDRVPYTKEDLNKLFNSPQYLYCRHKEANHYWVPLIAIYTGARQNEICQLFLDDIYKYDETDIFVFDINQKNKAHTKKSLKQEHHARVVPIHQVLINAGFLEYVNYLKNKGENRLFPELPYIKYKNKYATRFCKWFNNTYTNDKNCNITTEKASFHSLRHNVINYFSHNLNIDENKFAYVLGQLPVGNVATTTYIKPAELHEINKWYKKLDFSHCFDVKRIPNWKKFGFARQ